MARAAPKRAQMIGSSDTSDPPEQVIGQLRGGSLLLVGRGFAVGVNLLTQVLMIRWLSPNDYGALAYVLSLTWVARNFSTLGMHRLLPRLIPVYFDRHQYPKLFGAIGLQAGTILLIGLLLSLFLLIGRAMGFSIGPGEPTQSLLAILVIIVPLEALDYFLFEMVLAAFHRPRSIMLRKHVIGPVVKLSIILIVLWAGAGVQFLAIGLVASAAIGVAVYVPLVVRMFRDLGLTSRLREGIQVPWEALTLGLPLLTTDLMLVARNSLDAVVVDNQFGHAGVAQLRAVLPAANLNELVTLNFALLFMPLASRLIARGVTKDVDELYWRTAAWQTVLTMPIFLLTFSLSSLTTTTLFGEAYGGSAPILAVLSIGFFIPAAMGPSNLVLIASGRIRYLVVGNLLVTMLNVVLLFALVARFGVIGAAIATVIAQLSQRAYEHLGMATTPVRLFRASNAPLYMTVVIASIGLFVFSQWNDPGALGSLALVGAMVLLTVRLHRRALALEQTFPEAARIPGVALIFGLASSPDESVRDRSEGDVPE